MKQMAFSKVLTVVARALVLCLLAPAVGRTDQAKRAALGLARTGSTARHGSGDFMLAFSTANVIPHYPKESTFQQTHLADTHLNPLITSDRKSTRLNSSHPRLSRMPSSA